MHSVYLCLYQLNIFCIICCYSADLFLTYGKNFDADSYHMPFPFPFYYFYKKTSSERVIFSGPRGISTCLAPEWVLKNITASLALQLVNQSYLPV